MKTFKNKLKELEKKHKDTQIEINNLIIDSINEFTDKYYVRSSEDYILAINFRNKFNQEYDSENLIYTTDWLIKLGYSYSFVNGQKVILGLKLNK